MASWPDDVCVRTRIIPDRRPLSYPDKPETDNTRHPNPVTSTLIDQLTLQSACPTPDVSGERGQAQSRLAAGDVLFVDTPRDTTWPSRDGHSIYRSAAFLQASVGVTGLSDCLVELFDNLGIVR